LIVDVLNRDADITLEQARLRQLRFEPEDSIIQSPSESSIAMEDGENNGGDNEGSSHSKDDSVSRPESNLFSTLVETFNTRRNSIPLKRKTLHDRNWKDPQPYEVLRAVERKDIMYLMVKGFIVLHRLILITSLGNPRQSIPCGWILA
jgi:hypothetical protein